MSAPTGDSEKRPDPQRVLLAGDLHGNTQHARYLLSMAAARGCSVVLQVGDFGAWEHTPAGEFYFDMVADAAFWHEVPMVFLDGNHDNWHLVLDRYGDDRDDHGFVRVRDGLLYAPRGHRWTWSGTRFLALGGAYSVDKHVRLAAEARRGEPRTLWWPEEELIDEQITEVLADPTPVDVLLTHDKPAASNPGWNRKDYPECLPNQQRIQRVVTALQPRLLVHGHLHYRYSDTIRSGDSTHCRIEGLGGDPTADEHGGYRKTDSWMILDLPLAP